MTWAWQEIASTEVFATLTSTLTAFLHKDRQHLTRVLVLLQVSQEEGKENGVPVSDFSLYHVQRVCMHTESVKALGRPLGCRRSGQGRANVSGQLIAQLIQLAARASEFEKLNIKYCISRLKLL